MKSVKVYKINFLFLALLFISLTLLLPAKAKEIKVGAIPGDKGGNIVTTALDRIGANYTLIEKDDDYNLDNLSKFDAITMAIRAYKARPELRNNHKALLDYVKQGGYLFTLDGQADEAWEQDFMPYPLTLTDNDFPQIAANQVEITVVNHPIFNSPNKITPEHIEAIGNAHWAVYDYANEVKPPWEVLLKTGGFPAIFEAEYGKGIIIFNSVLVGETLSKVELKEAIEIGQNLIHYAEKVAAAVTPQAKLTVTWGSIKKS
ncbi:MAG: hypothetical protein ACE5NG_20975 [bacterium]